MRTIDECPSRGGTGSLIVVRFLKLLPFEGENQVGRRFTAPCVLWSICALRVGGRFLPTGLVARRIPPLTSRRYFRAPTAQLIVSVGSLGCNQDRFAFAARESCGTTSIENVFALRRETLG